MFFWELESCVILPGNVTDRFWEITKVSVHLLCFRSYVELWGSPENWHRTGWVTGRSLSQLPGNKTTVTGLHSGEQTQKFIWCTIWRCVRFNMFSICTAMIGGNWTIQVQNQYILWLYGILNQGSFIYAPMLVETSNTRVILRNVSVVVQWNL